MLIAAVTAEPSAWAQPVAVWPDNARIRDHISAARQQRIAVVGIGDSNQLYDALGWDQACTQVLAQRYGLWGTGLISLGESMGFGSAVGAGAAAQAAAPNANGLYAFSGAPPELEKYLGAWELVPPAGYLFVPPSSITSYRPPPNGMIITPSCGLDLHFAPITFHLTHGRFPDAPSIHAWVSPYDLAQEPFADFGVDTTGPHDVATSSFTLAPGMSIGASRVWIADDRAHCRGPFLGYYMQAEQPSRRTGAAFHTLYGLGGASLRDMAATLHNASDSQLTLFFQRVRATLGDSPRVIFRIVSGVNDRSEPMPSFESGIKPGNSAAAYSDNLRSIINRVRDVWAVNHWEPDVELRFVVAVSPPISTPDDPSLVAYRTAARVLAAHNPTVVTVDYSALVNEQELVDRDWYKDADTDHYHFTPQGHEEIARRELVALIRTDCWDSADADNNGEVNTRDLILFLEQFGRSITPGQGCDLHADGSINTADLALMLARFGLRTCNAEN